MDTERIVAIPSDQVRNAAADAWNEIQQYATSLPEPPPQNGRATAFLPTSVCKIAIDTAVKEYPEKAVYRRKIVSSRKGGVVYFPGQPKIGDTLTIMIPIHIQGEVTLNGALVNLDHYYHILDESTFNIPDNAKLFALTIDRMIT